MLIFCGSSPYERETNEMYKFRIQEGYYSHLNVDDDKFRGFLRLIKNQFRTEVVLKLVEDLKKQSANSVKLPIIIIDYALLD